MSGAPPTKFPSTVRECVLPWRLFNNPAIKVADRPHNVFSTAAALAALIGPDGTGTATAVEIGRMVHLDERDVRRALSILSRLELWRGKKHSRRATEWWVNVGQIPLFGESDDRAMVPGHESDDRAMVPGHKSHDRAMVPGHSDGTIRSITKSNNDDVTRAKGKDAPLSDPEAVLSSSSFLQKEIDGMGEADADEIASLRSLEWVAEWLSVIPYYRKKPIANVPAFLVRAARKGWKPPAAYIAQRDADRIAEARRKLAVGDELRARRPADAVTVEAEREAGLEKMRAAGESLRRQFAARRTA